MFVVEKTISEGATLAAQLGFNALSVGITNPTGQYLHLVDTNIYVLPGQSNAIFALPSGGAPDMAQAEWAPPPGIAQPAGTAGQQAVLTYYDVWLPPSPGIIVQVTASVAGTVSVGNQPTIAGIGSTVNTNAPQVLIGTMANVGPQQTQTFAVPAGTQALAVQIDNSANITHLKLAGHSTATNYLELYYFTQQIYALPYLVAIDGSVDMTVTGGTNVVTVKLIALQESVPEFLQLYAPPQLAPNQPAAALSVSIPVGNPAAAVITEATNVEIYLFPFSLDVSGGKWSLWEGTAATPKQKILGQYQAATAVAYKVLEFAGAGLQRGFGLYASNDDASAVLNLNGHIEFSRG